MRVSAPVVVQEIGWKPQHKQQQQHARMCGSGA